MHKKWKLRWRMFNPFEAHWARYRFLCHGEVTWDEAYALLENELDCGVFWREQALRAIMAMHRRYQQPTTSESYIMQWNGDELVLQEFVYDVIPPREERDDGRGQVL